MLRDGTVVQYIPMGEDFRYVMHVFRILSVWSYDLSTADIIGRRPVIIAGTLGLAITTVLLGLSGSLPEILIARCLGEPVSNIPHLQ